MYARIYIYSYILYFLYRFIYLLNIYINLQIMRRSLCIAQNFWAAKKTFYLNVPLEIYSCGIMRATGITSWEDDIIKVVLCLSRTQLAKITLQAGNQTKKDDSEVSAHPFHRNDTAFGVCIRTSCTRARVCGFVPKNQTALYLHLSPAQSLSNVHSPIKFIRSAFLAVFH